MHCSHPRAVSITRAPSSPARHRLRLGSERDHRLALAMPLPCRRTVAGERVRHLVDAAQLQPERDAQLALGDHARELLHVGGRDRLHERVRLLRGAHDGGRAHDAAQDARYALGLRQRDGDQAAARLEQRAPAVPARDVEDLVVAPALGARSGVDALRAIVNDHVRPEGAHHLDVLRGAHAGHVRAHRLGQLHRERADAARGAVDQHALAGSHRTA
mmetsp:Transcript_7630/g.18952  ORF Transcript_7630/g.18952 Transcript_7630/m.18952 type:complete len:216 (+) Transcript_7630:175-822(+)